MRLGMFRIKRSAVVAVSAVCRMTKPRFEEFISTEIVFILFR